MATNQQIRQTDAEEAALRAYEASVRLSIADVTKFLLEALGRSLVLRLSGVTDPKAPTLWASGSRAPRADTEDRLRAAFRAFTVISEADTEYAARGWFIGLNPQLDHDAPVVAISQDRLKDVVLAAQAFARTS